MTVSFFVAGTPRPKGSMRSVPYQRKDGKMGVRVFNDNPATKQWQDLVRIRAKEAMRGRDPIDGPVSVTATFLMPQLKRPRKRPDRKPDLDKLVRAVLDSLEGVAFTNDSRVTSLTARKYYAEGESEPGVVVKVEAA